MKLPNVKEYKHKGEYLQQLLDDANLSQAEAADLLGVDHRTMRRYVLDETRFPYSFQYALEALHLHYTSEDRLKPSALRKMRRDELESELEKFRAVQKDEAGASKKYQRAQRAITAIYAELTRRAEKKPETGGKEKRAENGARKSS